MSLKAGGKYTLSTFAVLVIRGQTVPSPLLLDDRAEADAIADELTPPPAPYRRWLR
jgi:hypothetical protein